MRSASYNNKDLRPGALLQHAACDRIEKMKYAVVIGTIVLGFGASIVMFVWLSSGSTSAPLPVDNSNNPSTYYNDNTSVVPIQSSTTTVQGQVAVSSASGGSMMVHDFTKDPRVIVDPRNAGHYHLAGGAGLDQVGAPYLIVYVASDQSFTISLEKEPLLQTRLDAEMYLMQMLGISKRDMCLLRYSVLVPNDVNEFYSGRNLGFSFCPGATVFPN